MNNALQPSAYFSGLSGLQLPVPKYLFPKEHQASSRLQYYATFFNSIEINSTFYKLPFATTLDKWNKSIGDNFKFTFKFWKQVSHSKGLSFSEADVQNFLNIVNNIGIKKGCLLIQFPSSIKIQCLDKLEKLLTQIRVLDPHHAWDIAMEFRDSSWYHEDLFPLIKFYKSIIVFHDKAGIASPFLPINSDIVYVRFHGPSGNYRGSYEKDYLSEYSLYIKEWLLDNKRVYVYFNNTMGDAFNNLTTLNKFLNDSFLK